MKRLIVFIVLFAALGFTEVAQAQLVKDSWSAGIGFNYPRFGSSNIPGLNSNYGGYINLQRNFNEHVGLRLKAGYNHLESQYTNPNSLLVTSSTNSILGDLDVIYYLIPCESISPYVFGGVGGNYRMLTNAFGKSLVTAAVDDNAFVLQYGGGGGLEWNIDPAWKLVTEFSYRVVNNSELDGTVLLSQNDHDSFLNLSVGIQYAFDKGEPSGICKLYGGLLEQMKDLTDYTKIEDMIVKHIPKEVTKEVVVEKAVKASTTSEKWVLVGNNFEFNKATLTAESYPMLYDAAKTLLRNSDAKVEIHGYTDNVGSESYNKGLSERRAEAVKGYLVSKGVASSRITTVGDGESNPVADNNTAEGRAMNRRIEFKIQ